MLLYIVLTREAIILQDAAMTQVTEITGIPVNVKKDWEAAAEKQGVSLVNFLIAAANVAIERIPETNEIKLSVRDQIQIAEDLAAPPGLSWRNYEKSR